MDLEQAKAIIEAFGPCSTIYECITPQEMVDDYEIDGGPIAEYVAMRFTVEGIWLERSREGLCYSSEDRLQLVINEHKEMRAGQRERLAAIGYKV